MSFIQFGLFLYSDFIQLAFVQHCVVTYYVPRYRVLICFNITLITLLDVKGETAAATSSVDQEQITVAQEIAMSHLLSPGVLQSLLSIFFAELNYENYISWDETWRDLHTVLLHVLHLQ